MLYIFFLYPGTIPKDPYHRMIKKLIERQVFICLTPSPLHTVYVYTSILIPHGRGEMGTVEPREKGRRATVHKARSKIPT